MRNKQISSATNDEILIFALLIFSVAAAFTQFHKLLKFNNLLLHDPLYKD